jgi:hypothetical protein
VGTFTETRAGAQEICVLDRSDRRKGELSTNKTNLVSFLCLKMENIRNLFKVPSYNSKIP